MSDQCLGMTTPADPGCSPDRSDAGHEVPSCPPPLELLAPVDLAKPDRHAVGQEMLGSWPITRAPADRTHRELSDPGPLVVTRRHASNPAIPTCHKSALMCEFFHSTLCQFSTHFPAKAGPPGSQTNAVNRTLRSRFAIPSTLRRSIRTVRPATQPRRRRWPASEHHHNRSHRACKDSNWPLRQGPNGVTHGTTPFAYDSCASDAVTQLAHHAEANCRLRVPDGTDRRANTRTFDGTQAPWEQIRNWHTARRPTAAHLAPTMTRRSVGFDWWYAEHSRVAERIVGRNDVDVRFEAPCAVVTTASAPQ